MAASDSPTANLICTSGSLTGSRFELGVDTTIGLASGGKLVVAAGSASLARRFVRIYASGGRHHVEVVSGAASLDGGPLTAPQPLERRHVITIPEHGEFVYSLAAAPVAAAQAETGPVPMPPPPSPPPARPEPDLRGTVRQSEGFGAIPQFRRTPIAGSPVPPVAGGTIIDKEAFGQVPDLKRAPTPAKSQPPANPPQEAKRRSSKPSMNQPAGDAGGVQDNMDTMQVSGARNASPFSLITDHPERGRVVYKLKLGDNVLGRGKDCDIPVPDSKKELSRKHVIVRVTEETVELIDLDGRNGTFVGGKRITKALITPGANFNLGPSMSFKLARS